MMSTFCWALNSFLCTLNTLLSLWLWVNMKKSRHPDARKWLYLAIAWVLLAIASFVVSANI